MIKIKFPFYSDGRIIFDIFLIDLFFIVVQYIDFASYADDNTIYVTGESRDNLYYACKNHTKNFKNGLQITMRRAVVACVA